MSDFLFILFENILLLSYNNFENKRSEFNNVVKIKGDYIYSVMECDFSGKFSLLDFFYYLLLKLSKFDFDNYLNKVDGLFRCYNLVRMLVL